MTDENNKYAKLIGGILIAIGIIFVLWIVSIKGLLPLMYKNVNTPRELEGFLNSPKDIMQGVKVNMHFLEIGKRTSIQILKGHKEHLYMIRPYKQHNVMVRNLTRPEVVDFCINITGEDFQTLRSKVDSNQGFTPAWQGTINNTDITIIKATLFSYIVLGLADKSIFISQVELAKRLGMEDDEILKRIIPTQQAWYSGFTTSSSLDSPFPVKYIVSMRDELIEWLKENRG